MFKSSNLDIGTYQQKFKSNDKYKYETMLT